MSIHSYEPSAKRQRACDGSPVGPIPDAHPGSLRDPSLITEMYSRVIAYRGADSVHPSFLRSAAQVNFEAGKFEVATQLFDVALAAYGPTACSSSLYVNAALSNMHCGNAVRAAELYTQALGTFPAGMPVPIGTSTNAANAHLFSENFAKASDLYIDVITAYGQSPIPLQTLRNAAKAHQLCGRSILAMRLYEDCLTAHGIVPISAQLLGEAALAALLNNQPERSVELFERTFDTYVSEQTVIPPDELTNAAYAYLNLGDLLNAIALSHSAMKANMKSPASLQVDCLAPIAYLGSATTLLSHDETTSHALFAAATELPQNNMTGYAYLSVGVVFLKAGDSVRGKLLIDAAVEKYQENGAVPSWVFERIGRAYVGL